MRIAIPAQIANFSTFVQTFPRGSVKARMSTARPHDSTGSPRTEQERGDKGVDGMVKRPRESRLSRPVILGGAPVSVRHSAAPAVPGYPRTRARDELIQRDFELRRAYAAAKSCGELLELAGLDRSARAVRGIREEIAHELVALHGAPHGVLSDDIQWMPESESLSGGSGSS